MHRNLIILFFVLTSSILFAQSDSNFVVSQNGTNMVKIIVEKETTLKDISSRYNVSLEILALFNAYTNAQIIKSNAIVKLPLVETNFYKNTSIANNQGFVPLYYIAEENEKVADVSRRFLIAEGTLYKWNKLQSQSITYGTALHIGWLKDNKIEFKSEPLSTTMESEKNLSYSPNNTLKQDLKNDFDNAKTKISKSWNQLGTNVKKITNPKPKVNSESKIINSSKINDTNLALSNNTMDTVSLSTNAKKSKLPQVNLPKVDVKNGFNNTTAAIGKTFNKIGNSINKSIDKIGGNKNNSYNKEKEERDARIKLDNEKKSKTTITKSIDAPLQVVVADAEIENKDVQKTIANPEIKNTLDIPAYVKDNDDAVLYQQENTEKTVKPASKTENALTTITTKKINPKSGKAITFYAGANGMHLAYTDYAPKDSKIVVENKKNGKKIIATVLGPLQKNGDAENGIFILLSDTVKKELNPSGENFIVEVSKFVE